MSGTVFEMIEPSTLVIAFLRLSVVPTGMEKKPPCVVSEILFSVLLEPGVELEMKNP